MQDARPPIHIRPAVPADAGNIYRALRGIAETVNELHKFTSTVDDISRDGFGPNAAFDTLIAEVGSEFAGISVFFPVFSTWRGRRGGYVQDLFVAEAFRGLGVADALMAHTAEAVRARGGAYIALQVDRQNPRAQAFYRRLGMELSSTDYDCYLSGEGFTALAAAAGSRSAT